MIPVYTTGTGIPRPGAPSRGVDGDTQPLFALPQRLFGAGAFDRLPYTFGNITDQLNLWLCPDTGRCRIDTESGDPPLVFDEHYACECGDFCRPQVCPLALSKPRIGVNVIHHNGLAAFVRLQQPLSKSR